MSIEGLSKTPDRSVAARNDRSEEKSSKQTRDAEQNRRKQAGQTDESGTLQALLALLASSQAAQQPAPQPNTAGGGLENLLQRLLQLLGLGQGGAGANGATPNASGAGPSQMIDEDTEGPESSDSTSPRLAQSPSNGLTIDSGTQAAQGADVGAGSASTPEFNPTTTPA